MPAEYARRFPEYEPCIRWTSPLRRGEIMALLGENGAGKSTLIKTLTGVYQRDAGRIELDGVPISPTDTAHAQRLGIGTVYQEVNLLPNMSVADNLFIGHEPRRFGFIDQGAMTRQASAIMASHGFEMDVTLPSTTTRSPCSRSWPSPGRCHSPPGS